MNFRRGTTREEPEMNLIPLIDVLLVILIFLMVTTTYSKYAELQINLPSADAPQAAERPKQIDVAVTTNGRYVVNRTPVVFTSADAFGNELKRAAGSNPDPMVVINADANATHQSVINVLEAARLAGFGRVTFSTQSPPKKK
ncbi:MAG: biopolymer transporter ExbD [Betaproteobacteria bacterium]|nr:biopolymer transporter ExbD [Betaproteobacteria bacterium]MBL8535474.1 biopolymer transporter ExbD [Betaproteobacteria bacterium]